MRRKASAIAIIVSLLLPLTGDGAADPYDVISELQGKYGFLVLDTIVARPVTQWRLNRGFVVEQLPLGRQTILVRLPAGNYRWQELGVPYFDLPHRYDTSDDKRWSFRIERQKINYAGTLIVDEIRSSEAVGVRFINRSSEIRGLLEQLYPSQLTAFGVIYTGWYRDDFLSLGQNGVGDAPR